jgi:hypothetical protein
MNRVSRCRPWRVALLVAGVCLLLFACAGPALAGEPAIPQSGLPLPPSVLPVIVLQGSDYDMGYQFAQQTNELFGKSILEGMQAPGGFTDQQILALKAYQWYVQKYTPEYIDMFKGMAAAATDAGIKLSYTEVLANYVGTKAYPGTEPSGSDSATLPPTCSAWAAWGKTTTNGGLITGQEMDPPWGSFGDNSYVAVIAYPATGNAYINVSQPGQWASIPVMPGINNKGVSTTGNAGEGWRPQDQGAGAYRVKAGLIPHILRFADSAAAARDLWLAYHQPSSWNTTISDVKGNAFTIESTGAFQIVRKPGDFGEGDFIYSRNTYFTTEGGKAILNGHPGKFYAHGGWALDPNMKEPPDSLSDTQLASVRTNQTMYNMFHEYTGHVDLNFAEMMFRHHGKIPADPWNLQQYRATKAKYYGNPGNLNAGFVTISQPDNGDGGVMNICTGAVGRVGLPYEAGPYDDVYQVAGTHTFYALALAGSPDATVGAAQSSAESAIANAYQKLMWRNYGDVGFEGLNALFSQANREYLEGTNWMTKAGGANGNEKLLDTSNAVSCFANAQAHAEQAYEGLVHPATTPTQLGLKRYIPYEYGF